MGNENTEISIIIPTLNEELNIGSLIEGIKRTFDQVKLENYEIFIVDDNSTDRTIEKIRAFKQSNINIIQRPCKLGIGSAYKDAFPKTKGNFIIIMDADLSHSPTALKEFYNILQKHKVQNDANNLVISSTRYAKNGKIVNWSKSRVIISKCANFIGKLVLNIKCSDITGSYRLYSRPLLDKIIKKTRSNGFNFQLEAIFYATRYKAIIEEVPITFVNRKCGESKLNSYEIINFCLALMRLFFVMLFMRY